MISKKIRKGLVVSACLAMCLTAAGCSMNNNKSDSKKNNAENNENINDIRTAKIINQQQAILKFTTVNKAGSVVSIKLAPSSGDNYIYTLIAVDKKGIEYIYTIDAKSGNITKTVDKGPIDKANPPEYIDFVPVLNVKKAGEAAVNSASNPDFNEILSYKLYAIGGKNVYEFTLTDGAADSPKTEKVYINAMSGKKLDKSELHSNTESKSVDSNKSPKSTQNADSSSDVE